MSTRVWSAYVYKGFILENSVESFENSWIELFTGISDETVRKRLIPISKIDKRIYKIVKHNNTWSQDINISECYKPTLYGKFHFYQGGQILALPYSVVEEGDTLGTYKNIVSHFFNKLNTDSPAYRIITPLRYRDAETLEEYIFGVDKKYYGTYSNYASDLIEPRNRFLSTTNMPFIYHKDGLDKYYKGGKEVEYDDYLNIFKDEYSNFLNNKLKLKRPDYNYGNTGALNYNNYPNVEQVFNKADLLGLYIFNINFVNLIRETIKLNEESLPQKSLDVLKEYLSDLESCIPDLQDHANYVKIINKIS